MARMHSNGKGSSGSKKPDSNAPSAWSNSDKKEVEKLIVELSNAGNSTASIGTILRDRYAVPDVRLVMGERISKILSKNDITTTYPEDMMN